MRAYSLSISSLPVYNALMDAVRAYLFFPLFYMFFFISGFLFFRSCALSRTDYMRKLRTRARTLLTPYLLWNGLALLAISVVQYFRPGFSQFLKRQVADFSFSDYLLIFWDKQAVTHLSADPHGPLLLQFWFLQCLMVLILLSPIIYYALRRLRLMFVILLGVLLPLSFVPECAGFNKEALFYFTLGAYFALRREHLVYLIRRPLLPTLVLVVSGAASCFFLPAMLPYSISLILLVFSATCQLTDNGLLHRPVVSDDAVFFIFAFHIFISGLLMNVIGMLPFHHTEMSAVLSFLLSVLINVALSLLAYRCLCRLLPCLCRLLTGGRSDGGDRLQSA